MNPDVWICIKRLGTRYLRPMNHANCESHHHTMIEREAEKVMIQAPDYCEIGKCYNIKNLKP